MKQEPIVVERTFQASAEKVWQALTDPEQVKQWYFAIDDFRAEVGHTFRFEGGKDGRVYTHECRVTEVIPHKKFAYTWSYKGYEGESLVSFELFPEGDTTRVRITHAGLETFPAQNPDFAKENFKEGWTQILGTLLKNFVESKTAGTQK